ncbi:MAG: PAS domain-containing protein, partial [Planctomycetaceae bacterium]
VFFVDLNTPHGVAEWVLYLPLVLAPVFVGSQSQIVAMGVVCSVLSVVGFYHSPLGAPFPLAFGNRVLGVIAMWLTATSGVIICRRSSQLALAMANLQRETAQHVQTKQALEKNEERLRLAMQGAGMGTWDEDLGTGEVTCSPSLLRMCGYETAPNGVISRDMWRSLIHPDDRERVLEFQEQAQRRHSAYSPEFRIIRVDDGAINWLALFGRFVFDDNNQAVRFLGVAFDITRRKDLETEVLEIAAREQQQIGQELHDGVGQELTGLGLMAQSLAQRLADSALEQRIAARLISGLDEVHEHVRELTRGLIPVHVESKGLLAALDDLAARTTEQSGISVTCNYAERVELPDHATATQLFRIAQEAVSNALRHGRPRKVCLELFCPPNGLRLCVKDDGVGIPDPQPESNGIGLRIMQYRAGVIGAVLRVESPEKGGTVVTCTLSRRHSHEINSATSISPSSQNPDRG